MNKNTIGFIIIVSILILTSFVSIKLYFRERSDHDRLDINTFPHKIGDWTGRDLEITDLEYKILETKNLISREYTNSEDKRLYLFIVYSETNRSVFHPPEVCLMGGGISINNKNVEPIDTGKFKFMTNKLYLEKGNRRDIALYSYKAGNLYTENFLLQQTYFTLNQLIGRQRGGATIRVAMPILEDEDSTLTDLKGFMVEAVKNLEEL